MVQHAVQRAPPRPPTPPGLICLPVDFKCKSITLNDRPWIDGIRGSPQVLELPHQVFELLFERPGDGGARALAAAAGAAPLALQRLPGRGRGRGGAGQSRARARAKRGGRGRDQQAGRQGCAHMGRGVPAPRVICTSHSVRPSQPPARCRGPAQQAASPLPACCTRPQTPSPPFLSSASRRPCPPARCRGPAQPAAS